MSRFLEQWFEPQRKPPEGFEPDTYEEANRQRIIELMTLAYVAGSIPRRLGSEATPEELAQDKRLTRKLRNRLMSLLRIWGGQVADFEEHLLHHSAEYASPAAIVDWHEYLEDYFEARREDLRDIAALAYRKEDPLPSTLANRYANRIVNETSQVHQLYISIYPEKSK